jgi:pectate lyase
VISVSGTIEAPESISDVIDKTLIGTNDAEITGGLTLRESNNVVIKNILFSNGEGGSGDTLEVSMSTCIWIDHCEFRDGSDGNLDIVRQSDFVTVSWSRFYYTSGHDHMLSNLCGNGQPVPEDEGKLNVTFHHNWWGAGVKERMPRVRYGKVHVFNNYYKYEPVSGDAGQSYNVAAGFHSKLVVENNYFDGTNSPIVFHSDEGTAEVVHSGNEFAGTSGDPVSRGASFTPPYQYQQAMNPAAQVKALVTAGAGRK